MSEAVEEYRYWEHCGKPAVPVWDRRFLALAEYIAGWSKDPSTQCGAVIVDPSRRIVSTGYNGLARGVVDSDARLMVRGTKYNLVIHAEENALLYARQPLDGCTMYVWPMSPCSRCAAKIIQCGITRVVAGQPDTDTADRWQNDWIMAKEMYREAGVDWEVIDT